MSSGQRRHRHRYDAGKRPHRDVDQRPQLESHPTIRAVYPRLRQHGARRRAELSAATRTDPTAVKAYLDANRSVFDIDGDGNVDAMTDGLLILRYLFGLRGDSLINGAFVPGAPRNTAELIESYLATLTP